MKIGILSMQRVVNYGSFWQAYLLKEMLAAKKHKIEFIDIMRGRRLYHYPSRISTEKIKHLIKRIYFYVDFMPKRKKIYNKTILQELNCTEIPNYRNDYDCIIIGSDEVFNFAQPAQWGFSTQLHGAIDNAHISSYAASFGASTYEDIVKYDLHEELAKAMSNLKNISVRDENSYYIVHKLLPERTIYRHLDPVLIGDLPIPKKKNIRQKYIVIYAYDFRFKDRECIQKVKEFARKNDYQIYSVGFYQTWVDRNINVDPYELLQYIVNAEYVVTDTFHGTILFSSPYWFGRFCEGNISNHKRKVLVCKCLCSVDYIIADFELSDSIYGIYTIKKNGFFITGIVCCDTDVFSMEQFRFNKRI